MGRVRGEGSVRRDVRRLNGEGRSERVLLRKAWKWEANLM